MGKIKTFFRTLFKSTTDPQYYNDVVAAPSSFSWKYFFAYNLLAAVITGVTLLIPVSLFDVPAAIHNLANQYPSDLTIHADQTGLHINQPLPYSIPLSSDVNGTDAPQNLLTFVSDESLTKPADVQQYNAIAVVTESTVYMMDGSAPGQMKVYALPKFDQPMTVDRSTIDNAANNAINNRVIQQKLYVPIIGLALLILVYPLMLLMRVITLLIYSAVTFVVVKVFMKTKQLTYGKVLQISIHSIMPSMIIAYVLGIFSYLFFQGWLYFIVYLAWSLFVISKLTVNRVTAAAATSPVAEEPIFVTPARPKSKSTKTAKKSR